MRATLDAIDSVEPAPPPPLSDAPALHQAPLMPPAPVASVEAQCIEITTDGQKPNDMLLNGNAPEFFPAPRATGCPCSFEVVEFQKQMLAFQCGQIQLLQEQVWWKDPGEHVSMAPAQRSCEAATQTTISKLPQAVRFGQATSESATHTDTASDSGQQCLRPVQVSCADSRKRLGCRRGLSN